MSRLHISTRGIGSWRERLASPDRHWRRERSAFETAVSWEWAALRRRPSQLPEPIERLFLAGGFGDPTLLIAVAEHQVELAGRGNDSHCDVWGLVGTTVGTVSLSVEAKAQERFGNETLQEFLTGGTSPGSPANRQARWTDIEGHLPTPATGDYLNIRYQLLHRCATAVIEARRLRLRHAAFVVQAFGSPPERADEFTAFCAVMGITPRPQTLTPVNVNDVRLDVGWADCPFATDQQVAAVA